MPRLVRHDSTGPFKIEPSQFPRDEQGNLKALWVCACGLSSTMPLCDKSHKACKDEDPSKTYFYDPVTKVRSEQAPNP